MGFLEPAISVEALPNGVRVVQIPRQAGTAAVHVFYLTGSRSEPLALAGGCHLMEHLFFKGTAIRPGVGEISRAFDDLAASNNAWTNREATAYHFRAPAWTAAEASGVLADMLLNALIRPEDFEREKQIVLEEKRGREDDLGSVLWENGMRLMFGDTPLGRATIGTDDSIRALDREALLAHVQDHYASHNIVIGISGAFEQDTVDAIVAPFAALPERQAPKVEPWTGPAHDLRAVAAPRDSDQLQLALLAPALSTTHPDQRALGYLLGPLGGGASSRLFAAVREERQLAYSVEAGSTSFTDAGYVSINAGVDPAKVGDAVSAIVEQVQILIRDGFTDEEIHRARRQIAAGRAQLLEDHEGLLGWAMSMVIDRGAVPSFEEYEADLLALTSEDLQRLAGRVLAPRNFRLATVGGSMTTDEATELLDRALGAPAEQAAQ